MKTNERDELLAALGHLGCARPDAARSSALIAQAARTIAHRRRRATTRMALAAGIYSGVIEPAVAGVLSAGFLAAVLAQAVFVIAQAHAAFLWR